MLSREKPQWSEARFLIQGWGWPHLGNTRFRFLGLLGFQVPVPVLLSRPALTPTRPCLRSPQEEENDIILGRVGWGMETYFREFLWTGKFYKTMFFSCRWGHAQWPAGHPGRLPPSIKTKSPGLTWRGAKEPGHEEAQGGHVGS